MRAREHSSAHPLRLLTAKTNPVGILHSFRRIDRTTRQSSRQRRFLPSFTLTSRGGGPLPLPGSGRSLNVCRVSWSQADVCPFIILLSMEQSHMRFFIAIKNSLIRNHWPFVYGYRYPCDTCNIWIFILRDFIIQPSVSWRMDTGASLHCLYDNMCTPWKLNIQESIRRMMATAFR